MLTARLPLHCHPTTTAPAVRALTALAETADDGGLKLTFLIQGDIARLRIPEARPCPTRTDRLWEQTCFEAFIARPGEKSYREFNFAPSGDWALYGFSDYRTPMSLDTSYPPRIEAIKTEGRFEINVHLIPECLPPRTECWEIGLTAVVEAADIREGCHSYWALHHAGELPDFHRRESFILRL